MWLNRQERLNPRAISNVFVNFRLHEFLRIILYIFERSCKHIESSTKCDDPYLSLSSPRTTYRLSRRKLVQRGRRIGGRDEVEKETAKSEKKRREKAGRTCFSTRISHREARTEQTRRCRSRRWRGTKQCCIVALEGLLTQVSECIRTRDTCARLFPPVLLQYPRSVPLPLRCPQIRGRLRVSIAWLGKCREW